jgi:hypothetical protein
MNNAENAFHWLVEHYRAEAGWSAQSYHFDDKPLRRARLAIVYDINSPRYKRYAPSLAQWVQGGGRVLIWNGSPSAADDPLLDGLQFTNDTSHRPPSEFAFDLGDHALLRGVSGGKYAVAAGCAITANIRQSSADWSELAYTVVNSVSTGQFYSGDEPFGPRWVSLMNPARISLALVRRYGKGEVVFAQLGTCNIGPSADMSTSQLQRAPAFLRDLAKNVIAWAGAPPG